MLSPVLIGLLAAVVVSVPRLIRAFAPGSFWTSPALILGVAALAMLAQRFLIDRRPGHRSYDGLADLFIHIHSPSTPDSALRWVLRGAISFLLTLFGGIVGPEGAAAELTHALEMAMRPRSSRWFEQRRRTDAGTALAAGVSAAFGAPFAAVVLPIELGIGGRTLSAAVSALSAFLGMHFLGTFLPSRVGVEKLALDDFDVSGALYGFHFVAWRESVGIVLIGLLAGVVGAGVIRFVRYSQDSLSDLFQTQVWMRTLTGGVLLYLVMLVYLPGHEPSWQLLEQVLWARKETSEVLLLFAVGFLSLALLLSAFGTMGLFWPLFALGGYFGYWLDHSVVSAWAAIHGFSAVAGLAGGAAFWGAVLGAPVAGALVAFELTQNFNVLLPCLIAGWLARKVRVKLKTDALVHEDLEARGVALIDGRSASVLDSVQVREAMVTDHETAHEQEPVSQLQARLLKSKYPFLPVVNAQGVYQGMLTTDMVQESWLAQASTSIDGTSSNSPLSRLLEAKDLLYRASIHSPTVKLADKLSVTAGLFEDIPCVAVLGDDRKVVGLLFVYNVRLAYDREVARRSLIPR